MYRKYATNNCTTLESSPVRRPEVAKTSSSSRKTVQGDPEEIELYHSYHDPTIIRVDTTRPDDEDYTILERKGGKSKAEKSEYHVYNDPDLCVGRQESSSEEDIELYHSYHDSTFCREKYSTGTDEHSTVVAGRKRVGAKVVMGEYHAYNYPDASVVLQQLSGGGPRYTKTPHRDPRCYTPCDSSVLGHIKRTTTLS